jgi:hypothetical protein
MLSLASLWHVLALVLFAAITGTLSVRVMTKRLIT